MLLFAGKYYDKFRAALRWVICHRYATIGCMVVMMLLAAWSFKFIPKVFIPALDKQYFTLDVWLPEGTKNRRNGPSDNGNVGIYPRAGGNGNSIYLYRKNSATLLLV